MRPLPHLRNRPLRLAVAASLGLHLALLVALALLPKIERLQPEPDESVEVELVTPEQIVPDREPEAARPTPPAPSAAPPRTALPEPRAPATPPPPVPPALPAPPVNVRARRLLSDDVLSNPLSRGTREALARLEGAERIEQLCNLEAMGQIHAWKAEFEPDRIVADAMGGTRLVKSVMQADAAAFRSKRQWYRLKFQCELTPDRRKIGGFAFMVGDPIPRSEWRARNLPELH